MSLKSLLASKARSPDAENQTAYISWDLHLSQLLPQPTVVVEVPAECLHAHCSRNFTPKFGDSVYMGLLYGTNVQASMQVIQIYHRLSVVHANRLESS